MMTWDQYNTLGERQTNIPELVKDRRLAWGIQRESRRIVEQRVTWRRRHGRLQRATDIEATEITSGWVRISREERDGG